MPTRRTPIHRNLRQRITPEIVELFRLLREIQDAEDDRFWEAEGGRKREYSDASVKLHILLGRDTAMWHVQDAASPDLPSFHNGAVNDYEGAHALYVELEGYL